MMNKKRFQHQDYVPCRLWRLKLFGQIVGCKYCPYNSVSHCPSHTLQYENSPVAIISNLIKRKILGEINENNFD